MNTLLFHKNRSAPYDHPGPRFHGSPADRNASGSHIVPDSHTSRPNSQPSATSSTPPSACSPNTFPSSSAPAILPGPPKRPCGRPRRQRPVDPPVSNAPTSGPNTRRPRGRPRRQHPVNPPGFSPSTYPSSTQPSNISSNTTASSSHVSPPSSSALGALHAEGHSASSPVLN